MMQVPPQIPDDLKDLYRQIRENEYVVADLTVDEEPDANRFANVTVSVGQATFNRIQTGLRPKTVGDSDSDSKRLLVLVNGNRHRQAVAQLALNSDITGNAARMSSHMRRNLALKLGDNVTFEKARRLRGTGIIPAPKRLHVYVGRSPSYLRALHDKENKSITEEQICKFIKGIDGYLTIGTVYRVTRQGSPPVYLMFNDVELKDQGGRQVEIEQAEPEVFNVKTPVPSDADVTGKTAVELMKSTFSMLADYFQPSYADIGGYRDELSQLRQLEVFLNHSEVAQLVGGTSGVKNISTVLVTGVSGVGKTKAILALHNETDSELLQIRTVEEMPLRFAAAAGIAHGVWRDLADFTRETGEMGEDASKAVTGEILAEPLNVGKWKTLQDHRGKRELIERDWPVGIIVFLDDIDILISKDSKAATLGFKEFLERVQPIPNLIIIMNTNQPQNLHPILHSKVDMTVKFGLPSRQDRVEILRILTHGYKLHEDVNLELISEDCHGFTPHDLETLTANAFSNAINRQKQLGLLRPNETDRDRLFRVIDATQVTPGDFLEARKNVAPSGLKDGIVEKPDIKWDDVGIMPAIRDRIVSEVTASFQDPEIVKMLGKGQTRGILLYGPPGCGKTTIAKAIASERAVNFISIDVSKIFSGVMGEAEANLENQLGLAASYSPCIIFIDEIDTIGGKRKTEGTQMDSGSESRERVLNKMLTFMDGISTSARVLFIGATNRPQLLDPALLRPGRFNPLIHVMLPTEKARADLLTKLLRDQHVSERAVAKIARQTRGFSGADLEALVSDAQRYGRDRYLQHRILKEKYWSARGHFGDRLKSFSGLGRAKPDTLTRFGFNEERLRAALDLYKATTREGKAFKHYIEHDDLETEKAFVELNKQITFADLARALSQKKPSVDTDEIRVYEDFEANHPSGITDPEYLEAVESARNEFGIEKPKTRWEDIGGLDGVRKEIVRTIDYATRYKGLTEQMGYSTGRGFLFYGPPGCGKTLIAKAMAAELKMNFLEIKLPDIVSKWVGESEKNLQAKINSAKLRKPCILLMDEIDSLFTRREGSGESISGKLVNIILTEMDGMQQQEGLYFVGTTNRPEAIDPAILRAGRLDKKIYIPLPNKTARAKILKALTRKLPNSLTDQELERLADETNRFTGSDLGKTVNDAKEQLMRREIRALQRQAGGPVEIQREDPVSDDEEPRYKLRGRVDYALLSECAKSIKPNFDKEQIAQYIEFANKNSTSVEDEEYQKMIQDGGVEFSVDHSKVTWSDIGGLDFIRDQFEKALILPRREPELYERMGMRPPRGALLYGPPGCGKTMIGKALANQMGLPFTSITAADIKSIYDLKKLFERAKAQPDGCILFIDEMDTLVTRREGLEGHAAASTGEQTLVTTFLTNLDGVEEGGKFILIGATNHPENIDSAVMRPGRLDVKIYVPLPPTQSRINILKAKTRLPIFELEDKDYKYLAEQTEAFSGADLELLVQQVKSRFVDEAVRDPSKSKSRDLRDLTISVDNFKDLLDKKMVKPSVTKQMLYKYREFFDRNSSGINDPEYRSVIESATTELSIKRSTVTWRDIGGLDHIRRQFERALVLPREEPDLFKQLGLESSRGFLLYGPPGTGKTMIVKALSNQLNMPFLTFNSSELISKWVGESAQRVQAMFDRANAMDEGCILFIDEIDSVLSKRYDEQGYGSRHDTQVVTTFLTNMDGVERANNKTVLIGATNNPGNLDDAAIRPGRLSTKIYVGLPDLKQREQILRTITGKLGNVNINNPEYKQLARLTRGFSGADLDSLVSRAKNEILKDIDLSVPKSERKIGQLDFKLLQGLLERKEVQPSNQPGDMHRYREFCKKHGGGEWCDPREEEDTGVAVKPGERLSDDDADLPPLVFPK